MIKIVVTVRQSNKYNDTLYAGHYNKKPIWINRTLKEMVKIGEQWLCEIEEKQFQNIANPITPVTLISKR